MINGISTAIVAAAAGALVERGIDFLVKKARSFVAAHKLPAKLPPNQINSLKSVFERHSSDFRRQKKEVEEFIKKQSKKDEKHGGKRWASVGEPIQKLIFEFSPEEVGIITEQVKHLVNNPDLNQEIDTLFNEKIPASQRWLEEKLKPAIARRMFYAILTVYRCMRENISIPEI